MSEQLGSATDMQPLHEFHEIWWIFSQGEHEWCGLRIAHFRKASNSEGGSTDIVLIQGEVDPRRFGVRVWDDIKDREGWRKVVQIAIPTADEIAALLKVSAEDIEAGRDAIRRAQAIAKLPKLRPK